MKKLFMLIVINIIVSCHSNVQRHKRSELFHTIVQAYIEYRNSEREFNREENILTISANTSENTEDAFGLDIGFVNPKLLYGVNYTKVYLIDGYRLIIDESLNKSEILKKSFKETKFENLNLAVKHIDYSVKNWYLIFNDDYEIIGIPAPYQKSEEIKKLLMKRNVKFRNL